MNVKTKLKALAIVGPTAAGKSDLAMRIATDLGAEIVSIDSTTVYRGMDIGTAKPSQQDRQTVLHHLIDIADPLEPMTVSGFQVLARDAIADIASRGHVPLLVGGSGLYFRAVVDDLDFPATDEGVRQRIFEDTESSGVEEMYERLRVLDPVAAGYIQPENARRIVRALEVIELTGQPFSSFKSAWEAFTSIYDLKVVGLIEDRDEIDRRVEARIDDQLQNGLLDEVARLADRGVTSTLPSVQALGYAQLLAHLEGKTSFEEAVEQIKRRTRRFARRQLSWFKADPRIEWFHSDPKRAGEWLIEKEGDEF